MDTNKLKRFATEARNILIQGVANRLLTLGFNEKGIPAELPELHDGGAVFMGDTVSTDFYEKWMSLHNAIEAHSLREVAEEAAYTWFNRLVAIRIMNKLSFIAPVLEYEAKDVRVPVIVTEARQGRLPQMPEELRQKLLVLLNDDARTNEQFALLIVAYCHDNPIIHNCFGNIADYTELLLPTNILAEDGFIDMMNNSAYITEEDFQSPELIGWLYQFYISERKDEVFAKKGKFEADEIPAATQIFTPNWIVKYMVENTVGRIYLDNNEYATELKADWKYLVECEPTPKDSIYRFDDLKDLKVADLACGSGHILNECFDILLSLYVYEGYSRAQAIDTILRYNLLGIDLDTRAKQLATFALMMKACKQDSSFLDAHLLPRVYDMPKVDRYTYRDLNGHFCCALNLSLDSDSSKELDDAFALMEESDSLGSVMRFNISPSTREFMQLAIAEQEKQQKFVTNFEPLINGFKIILALTDKYSALVMNPPYMGGGNMNGVLSKYVKENYPDGKADLATVFVEMMPKSLNDNGRYSFIIPPSWMFLSTFEGLRQSIIDNQSISSLLHLSRGVFGADFGASSAVIANTKDSKATGTYFRLIERTFQEFDQKHLQQLFEKTLANHDFRYYFADYSKEVDVIVYSENGAKIYYPAIPQTNFEKIPGHPIGYWVSEKILETFIRNLALSAVANPCVGLQTADNARFLRLWFEVGQNRIGFGFEDAASAARSKKKWFPHNKGGSFRRWFGNQEYIVNWENQGSEIINFRTPNGKQLSRPQNINYYFRESISWSKIVSNSISFRYFPNGFIFDCAALSIFSNEITNNKYLLAVLNSIVSKYILGFLSPTMNCEVGQISGIPIGFNGNETKIYLYIDQNISISKQDWDAHETSWDFQTNELIRMHNNGKQEKPMQDLFAEVELSESTEAIQETPANPNSLDDCYEAYKKEWERKFYQLHANEEELNRQFIDIYGLQDELTPDVPLSEITILQQGEVSIESVNTKNEATHE